LLASRLGGGKRQRGVSLQARPEVDPRSGLGLDADPERRMIVAPGTPVFGCWRTLKNPC
jgi:hypothetical protein